MIFPETNAKDFAAWIVENKPYLVEIEDEIQKIGQFGEMEIKITVRGGRVEKLSFWRGKTWLREKNGLTPSTNGSK